MLLEPESLAWPNQPAISEKPSSLHFNCSGGSSLGLPKQRWQRGNHSSGHVEGTSTALLLQAHCRQLNGGS